MHTKKPIRFSTWTVSEKNKRSVTYTIDEIIVSGNKDDLPDIIKNSLYLGSLYKKFYGKERFMQKRKEGSLIVTDIKLSDHILGYTNK